jgi:hypothetical protein
MLAICNGMPRSASTWSFNVVLALLRRSSPGGEVYGGYDENIARFLKSAPATAAHLVVKCHQLDTCGRAIARWNETKTIYTWRDPADTVVSCMRMFDYDFERALEVVDSSLEIYQFHRKRNTALILYYPQIVSATHEAVDRIAKFLGINDCTETIDSIAELTSLERVRRKTKPLTDDASMVRHSGLEYDLETLLHREHIRDGGIGYGRMALTIEQSNRIDALCQAHGLEEHLH